MPLKKNPSVVKFQIQTRSRTRAGPLIEEMEQGNEANVVMEHPNLAEALRTLTQGLTGDRDMANQQQAVLVNALTDQQQQNSALVDLLRAQHPAGGRVSNAVVESIPRFEGGSGDFPQDFVDFISRVGDAENWSNAQRIQVASRRISKTAMDWHIHTGHTHVTWASWSAAFVKAFTRRIPFAEWHQMVEARRQRPGESGLEYALDKHKLLRGSPVPLNDAQMVSFLIDGLARWQHVAAMASDTPANVDAFIQKVQQLEILIFSSRSEESPTKSTFVGPPPVIVTAGVNSATFTYPPPIMDFNKSFAAFGDKLIGTLASRLERLNTGKSVVPSDGARVERKDTNTGRGVGRGSGYMKPDDRKCYHCNAIGHISRNCPAKSGNGEGGK